MAFVVSVGCLVAYFVGAVPFHVVHVSVLVKIGLMVGAVLTIVSDTGAVDCDKVVTTVSETAY